MKSDHKSTGNIALLFDLDGVIVDSNPVHVQVWRDYLQQSGIEPARSLPELMYGRRNDEIVRDLFGDHLSPDQVHRYGAEKEALYRRVMASQLPQRLVPGLVPFLEQTRDFPKAVVTNAEPANAEFILNGAGLRKYFSFVVDGHQVARPKPAPDIYIHAASLLRIPPGDCVVFEDSNTGVEAARQAGARVVAVTTTHSEFPQADLTIANFLSPDLLPWLNNLVSSP